MKRFALGLVLQPRHKVKSKSNDGWRYGEPDMFQSPAQPLFGMSRNAASERGSSLAGHLKNGIGGDKVTFLINLLEIMFIVKKKSMTATP